MKKLFFFLFVLQCGVSLSVFAQGGTGVKNGDVAPVFSAKDQRGVEYDSTHTLLYGTCGCIFIWLHKEPNAQVSDTTKAAITTKVETISQSDYPA
jgi:hypothetical protein